MTTVTYAYDLVCLVADINMEHGIKAILERTRSLDIKEINVKMLRHPNKDSGCLLTAHELLRSYINHAERAIVIFDYDGCGDSTRQPTEIEHHLESQLSVNGWDGRNATIVINPELEQWIWTNSERMPRIIGHECSYQELLEKLLNNGYTIDHNGKPYKPKESLEYLIKMSRFQRTSAIYSEIASKVSFRHCSDNSFNKLTTTLKNWYS